MVTPSKSDDRTAAEKPATDRDPSLSPSGINAAGVANSNKPPTHYTKEDVEWLVSELGKRDFGTEKVVLGEPYLFGLALDAYDPVSEQVITVARPRRRDLGEEMVFLVPDRVAAEVANARANRANYNRIHGILTEEELAARKKAAEQERAAAEAKTKVHA